MSPGGPFIFVLHSVFLFIQLLLYISDSERCEFVDISTNSNWNPKTSMETTSFLYSMGFVRPLSVKRPVYNLVRAIYFAEA